MKRFMRVCVFSSLALGVCLLALPISRGDDAEEREAKENKAAAEKLADPLKKLIDAVQNGKGVAVAQAAAVLDKNADEKLKRIMWAAYKPRDQGGLGVGSVPGAIRPDGVEAKIISMAKKPLPAAQLEKESADLIKMAEVAKAIAEMADLHTPKQNAPKKPIADWKKFNKLQKDSAKELIDAVKANDPDKVLDATKNLYSSCTNCHSVFRD
jgi:Cytochrome C'